MLTKIVIDILGYIFSVLPVVITWSLTICIGQKLAEQNLFWYSLPLIPILIGAVFISVIFLMRLLIPIPKAGRHKVGLNKSCVGWFLYMALGRAVKISGIRPMLHSFYITRFLLYRALGVKMGYGANTSIEFVLVDLPLITIGKNCVIGEAVHISCHYFLEKNLILRPITIGDNVFIGGQCVVGPGSQIGEGSWIGWGNAINGDTLPPNTKIPNFTWATGKPTQVKSSSDVKENN